MKNLVKHVGIKILAVVCLFACSDDDNNFVQEPPFSVQVVSTSGFGKVLMNQDYQAMYFFANDVNGESSCKGGCAAAWPVVPANLAELAVGSGLSLEDFGAIDRSTGESQLTYKGWPLYYFSPTANEVLESPGQISGDGAAGGSFYVAKPDYSVMLARQIIDGSTEAVVYLVDSRGLTLYDFVNDGANFSNCTGGCAGVWPPFTSPEYLILPSALSADDFSVVERADELGPQLSFKGQPLYHFVNDEDVRGNTLGHGGADGKFFVVEEPFQP